MNDKSAHVLELPKILEQLVAHSSFSAGAELIRQIAPTSDIREAQAWQQETTEARALFDSKSELTLGGARDVREAAIQATRGIVLDPQTFLDIRGTLRRATTIRRILSRLAHQFPALAVTADVLVEYSALHGEISQVMHGNCEILDAANPMLCYSRRYLGSA